MCDRCGCDATYACGRCDRLDEALAGNLDHLTRIIEFQIKKALEELERRSTP